MTPSSAVSKDRVFPLLVLPVILLIAVGVRFYGLGDESLWLDEIETVRLVNLPFSEMMHYITHADSHPPLFSLIMHGWCRVAGSSDFAVRFWSAVFGSLTVWLTYLIGTTLFERSVGLMAALLLALSPFHVYYSQEARMYALLCLLSAGIMFVLRQVTIDGRPRQRVLLALLSIAALYTQNIAIFLIVLMNIWYVISYRHQRTPPRDWIIMNGCIFLAYVPWFFGLYHQLGATRDIGFLSWIQSPTLAHLFEVLLEFCGAFPLHAEAEPTVWYFLTSGSLFLLFIVCTVTLIASIFRRTSTRTISQPAGQPLCEDQQTTPHIQNDSSIESL